MATVLFINRTDLIRNSILDGNVDTDKFIQFIKISQQINIQNYLVAKHRSPAFIRYKIIR